MAGERPSTASVLLCDFAEIVNDKLYLQGGGWTRLRRRTPDVSLTVAVIWQPAPDAGVGTEWPIAVSLQYLDGTIVVDSDGTEIRAAGGIVLKKAHIGLDEVTVPLVFQFTGLDLPEGVYRFDFAVAGESAARTDFILE